MTTDVAIVIGHRPGAPGAVSCDGTTEYEWNSVHAERLAAALWALGKSAVIVLRPDQRGGYGKIPGLVNATGAKCCVALHFNGSGNRKATGSEVLHYRGSKRGEALARALDVADDALGLKDRGLGGIRPRGYFLGKRNAAGKWDVVLPGLTKAEARSKAAGYGDDYAARAERGTPVLEKTAMPCALVEPAFGSNPDDWQSLNANAAQLARAQARAIADWLDAA